VRKPFLPFLLAAPLLAQGTQTSSFRGAVVDEQGHPLPEARVRVVSERLQGVRTATTDAKGQFLLRLLPPGAYTLEVAIEGYQTVKLEQRLGVDQAAVLRVILPKISSASVTTRDVPPEIDLSEVQHAVNRRMTEDIKPLPAEQNLDDVLQTFNPGIADTGLNAPHVRGSMSTGNVYLVDGQNIQDGFQQASGISLIEDGIQEVEVITGAIPAEYGQVEGGVVNAVTPSGGNDFHGYLRFELGDAAWNALQPKQDKASIIDHVDAQRSFTLGGPIVKDKLWFFLAGFDHDSSGPASITSNAQQGPGGIGAGQAYTSLGHETRFQGKLTWAINPDNTLIANVDHSVRNQHNQDPTAQAGEVAALVQVRNTYGFYNLDWRSLLSSAATLEVRLGRKFQDLTQGADPAGGTPLLNTTDGLVYRNGLFDNGDGGQHYDTRTGNAKLSLLWDGAGTHVSQAGLDWRDDLHRARANGSATGMVAQVSNLDLNAGTAQGAQLDTYQTFGGESSTTTFGFWADDKWSVNDRIFLQLGARADRYTGKRENGSTIASATSFSPRLGLKYDLTGHEDWILNASYSRYTGRVLQTYLDQATHQGNPTVISYQYTGPAGAQPFSVLTNRANYGPALAGYSDPAVNVRVDAGLKPPSVDEWQLGLTRSFRTATGDGFLRATLVKRTWHNLIDYRIGNEGQVTDGAGNVLYVKRWTNEPDARRDYKDLELEGAWHQGPWAFSGHITWARLEGNYEGEAVGQPGTGEGIHAWDVQGGTAMFDRNAFHPSGDLQGNVPIRMRLFGQRTDHLMGGTTTWGLIYRFTSGQHYNQVRSIDASAVNPALSLQAGSTFTQYMDNTRGSGVFNSQAYTDFSFTQEWKVATVRDTPVQIYIKLVALNAFNHQAQITWNTNYAPVQSGSGTVSSPFAPGPDFHQPLSSADYAGARAYVLHLGCRF
jgi:hypothetical protein